MATCKDCFNAELCTKWAITYDETPLWDKPIECDFFKDKSQYAEVKRGEWKDYYNNKYSNQLYVCSVCGKQALYEYFTDELDHIKTRQVLSVVCPHCGANMNGGNNGNL